MGFRSGRGNKAGGSNVFIGYRNVNGSYNTFTGFQLGNANVSGNNRLYIDNSNITSTTNIPLIYGKFDTDQLGLNTTLISAGYAMAVKGKLITEEIKVQTYGPTGWPDYVFEKTTIYPP